MSELAKISLKIVVAISLVILELSYHADAFDKAGWPKECGLHHDSGFPSFANISVKYKDGSRGRCGGVLVTDQLVLTSWTCLKHGKRVKVTLGFGQESARRRSFMADRAYGTKYFFICPTSWPNVILALLHLNKPVVFDRHIQPACMIPEYFHYPEFQKIKELFLVRFTPDHMSPIVEATEVEPEKECPKYFAHSYEGTQKCLNLSRFDIEYGGKGDQGDPLYVFKDGKPFVAGILDNIGHSSKARYWDLRNLDVGRAVKWRFQEPGVQPDDIHFD